MYTTLLIAAMLKLEQFNRGAAVALDDFGPVLGEPVIRMITITNAIWDYNYEEDKLIFVGYAE